MVEFEAIVRGNPDKGICVGKINSVKIYPLIGKKVKVIVEVLE